MAAVLVLVAGCSSTPGAELSSGIEVTAGVPSGVVLSGRVPSGAVPSGRVPSDAATWDVVPSGEVPSGVVPSSAVVLGPVGVDGVNDPSCVSAEPPVVLLHGTLSSIAVDFPVLGAALVASGRCVFGADYGRNGLGAVRDSAATAAAVIREVSMLTGAGSVDVVGFSQGGLVLRTALRSNGVAGVVRTAVLISPSFHGTTSPLVSAVPAAVCPACADQAAGSALLAELDAGGDLDGDVRYAVAVTSTDAVVTPWQRQLPDGPADRVRSVVVDQQCPGLVVRHEDMARTPAVVGWTVAALAAGGDVAPTALRC